MKKYVIAMLIALLILAGQGFAQVVDNSSTLGQMLIANEKAVWDVYKWDNKDPKALSNLLADEYCEIDEEGEVATKADVVDGLNYLIIADYVMSDIVVTLITENVAAVRFQMQYEGYYKGETLEQCVIVSSVWVHRGEKWLNVSCQESPITKEK